MHKRRDYDLVPLDFEIEKTLRKARKLKQS